MNFRSMLPQCFCVWLLAAGLAAAAPQYSVTPLPDGFTPTAMNSAGQIVGSMSVAPQNVTHAFLYHAGALDDLGTLGGDTSYAYGINDAGAIVGESQITKFSTPQGGTASPWRAFLYSAGSMTDLGSLHGPDGLRVISAAPRPSTAPDRSSATPASQCRRFFRPRTRCATKPARRCRWATSTATTAAARSPSTPAV